MGDKQGADSYVKKYALELGYVYQEMNPPHTLIPNPNLNNNPTQTGIVTL